VDADRICAALVLQGAPAVPALWWICQDTNAVPVLADELDKAQYTATRWEILQTLRQIGPRAGPAIPSILRVIIRTNLNAAPEGWAALRKIDPQGDQARMAWAQLLNDPRPEIRAGAEVALAGLSSPGSNGVPGKAVP
jgi:hypothetical protein